jgi:putative aldouronate transport system permease protein
MVGVVMAFQDYHAIDGLIGSTFVGLDNFIHFFQDKAFYLSLRNTLVINGLNILFGFPLPIAFAIFLFTIKDGPFKKISQTLSYMPHFISWVVVSGMVYKLLDAESGVVNMLITAFGADSIAFMRTPSHFWTIITSTAIWKELGWNTIIYLAALSAVDVEQYEASIVDGATSFQKLVYITFPGIMPTIALMMIFTIGNLINSNGNVSFDAIFNMRNVMLSDVANTLDYFIYQEGVMRNRVSYAASIGIFQNVISLGIVLMANRLSKGLRGSGAF